MDKQIRHESRALKIKAFEESTAAQKNNQIFGLPFSVKESELVIIPVPWEVTVSFRPGTANGPRAIRDASYQVDLYDPITPDAWKYGFSMQSIDKRIQAKAHYLRAIAADCIGHQEQGCSSEDPKLVHMQQEVNQGSNWLNNLLYKKSLMCLNEEKIVGVVGGDHSVPLGLMQALATKYGSYGILHIDAHFDQRDAFEGFEFSHASIMRNASRLEEITQIVHVGIRDYCREEAYVVTRNPERFQTFTDRTIAFDQFIWGSDRWLSHCSQIIASLPPCVYISFDIDGLDPSLCPHTGTTRSRRFELPASTLSPLASSAKRQKNHWI
ncbi:MAG: arginase family protein [Patescibacteria group bacterium]